MGIDSLIGLVIFAGVAYFIYTKYKEKQGK